MSLETSTLPYTISRLELLERIHKEMRVDLGLERVETEFVQEQLGFVILLDQRVHPV